MFLPVQFLQWPYRANFAHSGAIVPPHMQASRSVHCPGTSAALLLGWCAECGTSPRQRYLRPRLLIHFSRCNQLFDKTKKPTHMEVVSAPLPWGSLPPIGSVHFIPYISTLGPKSGFMTIPTRYQNRRLGGWSHAPKVEPRRPVHR